MRSLTLIRDIFSYPQYILCMMPALLSDYSCCDFTIIENKGHQRTFTFIHVAKNG